MEVKDVECPYCENWCEINHDDGYGYTEGVLHNQQCSNCGKTFSYETSVLYCYDAKKADCLNGQEHEWEPTKTYPTPLVKMECKGCGEERELTSDERAKLGIPSIKEYLESLNHH